MKPFYYNVVILMVLSLGMIWGCSTGREGLDISEAEKTLFEDRTEDSLVIAYPPSNYEIVILEPGFPTWLATIARPEGYYPQEFLEFRNEIYVLEWNRRVLEPNRYDPLLYQLQIDYEPAVDYGYEVNYKLYNYFIYFQRKYKQRLASYIPRI